MNIKTFSFDVGDFKCVSISDGIQPIDGDFLPNFFAGASADELAEAFRRHGISPDYYELQCNCLLIDTGTDRVLIDSGGGPFFDPHSGQSGTRTGKRRIQAERYQYDCTNAWTS